jgi:Uma2 family endonuclease
MPPVVAAPPEAMPAEPAPAAAPDSHYEVIDGRIVEKPPMGAYECIFASWMLELVGPILRALGLGRLVNEVLFNLGPRVTRQRRPDLAFVSFERWPRGRRVPRGEAWALVPEIAIEVTSPSNALDEVLEKLDDYFRAGVRRVWVIHPLRGVFYDYASPTEVQILTRADVLDGGDVLPGFRLPLADLFTDELAPEEAPEGNP